MRSLGLLISLLISIGIILHVLLLMFSTSKAFQGLPKEYVPVTFEDQSEEIILKILEKGLVLLSLPNVVSEMRVEEAILLRRSIREYT
ncbi:MAG: hypothetical protein QXE81_00815 [Desulfurococcaceae archaeon]